MTRSKFAAATAFTCLFLAACGSGDDAASDTTAPIVDTTTADTTPAETTTTAAVAPVTEAATTTTAEVTTTVATGQGDALTALAPFLAEYDMLGQDVIALTATFQAAAESGAPEFSDADLDASLAVGERVYGLAALIPAGLDPSVEIAAVNAAFTMGQAAGPFLFAPGFSVGEWPEWTGFIEAGQAGLPAMSSLVTDAASAAPAFTPADPNSQAAAEQAAITLAMVRTFGHGGPAMEVDPIRPAVRWLGALNAEAEVSGGYGCVFDPSTGANIVPTGDFEDGRGGCALVYYDGDAELHEPEVAAWLDGTSTTPPGEPVAFVLHDGAWDAIGSAE